MKKKPLTTATVTMATALAVAMGTPLAGCSGCSAKRESGAIEKTTDSKSVKKEAGKQRPRKTRTSRRAPSPKQPQKQPPQAPRATAAKARARHQHRQPQAKQAPVIPRSPTVTERSRPHPRRIGFPKRDIGKQITSKFGFRISFIRATNAGAVRPAELLLILPAASTPMFGKPMAICNTPTAPQPSTTPTPPRRTRATTSGKPQASTGSWTPQATGSNPPSQLSVRRSGDPERKPDKADQFNKKATAEITPGTFGRRQNNPSIRTPSDNEQTRITPPYPQGYRQQQYEALCSDR